MRITEPGTHGVEVCCRRDQQAMADRTRCSIYVLFVGLDHRSAHSNPSSQKPMSFLQSRYFFTSMVAPRLPRIDSSELILVLAKQSEFSD